MEQTLPTESKKKSDNILNELKKDHHVRFWVSFVWYFLIYVIFLPVTIGYLLSKVLLRGLRFLHYIIAKRQRSLKFIIFCNTALSMLAIIIAVGLFVFSVWSVEQNAFINDTWTYNGDNQIVSQFNGFFTFLELYLVYGVIFGFSVTYFLKILLVVACDQYIRAVKVRDQTQITKLKETGVTFVPNHPMMKIVERWIDYAYGEKLLHYYEFMSGRERKNMILSPRAGQIISKEERIVFYKEYWKNHCIFSGGSKAGITNGIITYIAHAASQGSPIIYLDSVFDPQTRKNLLSIAKREQTKIAMIDFVDKTTHFNIFKDKTIDQLTKLFLFSFDAQIRDKVTSFKLTYLILSLIAANPKTTMNFKTIIQHYNVKYLTATYDKESNFELFDLITNKTVARMVTRIRGIFVRFNKIHGEYFSEEKSAIAISDILKSQNHMLYINIPYHHSRADKQKFSRLILQDVTLMSSFNARERKEMDKTAVFYTPLFPGLFWKPSDITISLATLTNNNVGLALEIKEGIITAPTLPALRELFVLCKTFFIYRTQNEVLIEAIKYGMDITHTRGVKAHDLAKDSINDNEIKYYGQRDNDKYKEFSDTIKNNVLANIKDLPSWKIYYKTLHFSTLDRTMQLESIVFADFFSPIQFNPGSYAINETKK